MIRGRRLLLLALPVVVGLLGAGVAAQYPRADVPGGVHVGPRGLARIPSPVVDYAPSLAWAPGHRRIELEVRPLTPCRISIGSVTSTAPGRIEVPLVERGRRCTGHRSTARFLLPPPTLNDARRNVSVLIGGETLHLHWARGAPPGPPAAGNSDAQPPIASR